MSRFAVVGLTRFAMTVPVDRFPLEYSALRHASWMGCAVVGGAYNIASALAVLGDSPQLCTQVGKDDAGHAIRTALKRRGLDGRGVVTTQESPKTVIFVDSEGRVARNAWNSETWVEYPMERYIERAVEADLAIVTSHPFGKPFLGVSKELLKMPVAVDMHLAADLDNERQRPWFESADVLFCSHERLSGRPEEWIAEVLRRYPGCRIVAVGRGAAGCVMGLWDGRLVEIEAVTPRPIRSTDGAGDALFASFLHGWLASGEPVEALESAVLFAGWKIGAESASEGFVTRGELAALRRAYPMRTRVGSWR